MAQNTLPSGIYDLMWLGVRMLGGRETHGPWLKLPWTEEFRTALAEMRTAEARWSRARAAKAAAGTRNAAADLALTAWLGKARLVLMLALGSAWSERWLETGFTQRGTNVPKRLGARLGVARGVIAFLQKHPRYEVAFAQVTAGEGRAIVHELEAAQQALRQATSAAGPRKRRRDAAEKTLRREMTRTRVWLSTLLTAEDARWLAFGLHIPKRGEKPKRSRALPKSSSPVIAPIAFPTAQPESENPAQAVA